MAKANLIAPFPADIDRDSFGHWLSGFTDGEGHLSLSHHWEKKSYRSTTRQVLRPRARFAIALRSDDIEILHLIQSYLVCGRVCRLKTYSANPRRHPIVRFQVDGVHDLATCVIPHFDTYPLRAKKLRDYIVWKKGIELLMAIYKRPNRAETFGNKFKTSKWTRNEHERFDELARTLRSVRSYSIGSTQSPELPSSTDPQSFLLWADD